MPCYPTGHARIKDHVDRTGLSFPCAKTTNCAFASAAPNIGHLIEISKVEARRIIVIAFHGRALAGNGADGTREAGCHILAEEAVRRRQNEATHAHRSSRTVRIGYATH